MRKEGMKELTTTSRVVFAIDTQSKITYTLIYNKGILLLRRKEAGSTHLNRERNGNYPGCQVQGSQFRGSTWSHEPLSMPRVINRLMKNPHLTVNGSANNH